MVSLNAPEREPGHLSFCFFEADLHSPSGKDISRERG